ncbi:hypothetical protein [Silvanigrella sp.]|jgi:hypothetical protein|uniref:hypothetical protein n=1 Tax=Silvanigrella sp. TaxID=2024976 RepID=UPI0037CC6404
MIIYMVEKNRFQNLYPKLKQEDSNFLDYMLSNVEENNRSHPSNLENKRIFIKNLISLNTIQNIKVFVNSDLENRDLLNHYYFVPWFYFYSTFEDFKNTFLYFLTKNKSYLENISVNIDDNNFKIICEKVLATYANPVLGKIPLSKFSDTVVKLKDSFLASKNISENSKKWFDFFNDYNLNSYNKFYIKYTDVLNEIKKIKIREKNKAEYTICYSSEKEVFNDILSKIIAKYKGNSLIQKKLALVLSIDNKKLLYLSQKELLINYFNYINKEINNIDCLYSQFFSNYNENTFQKIAKDLETSINKSKDIIKRVPNKMLFDQEFNLIYNEYELNLFNNNIITYFLLNKSDSSEYFKYFLSKNEYKNILGECQIKKFSQFVYFFLEYEKLNNNKLFIKTNNLLLKFPLVSIGAMIINDIRRCIHTLKDNISNKLKIDKKSLTTEENISNIVVGRGVNLKINREESKYNMIGKASYNVRSYQLENSNEDISSYISDLDKVKARNKFLHEKGIELGNGISGHIAGIKKEFLKSKNLFQDNEYKIEATINCSMFLFWSLFYDKTSTASHSYIEVFESSSFSHSKQENIQIPFPQDKYHIFEYILEMFKYKTFDAVDFIDGLQKNNTFKVIEKSQLYLNLYSVENNSI